MLKLAWLVSLDLLFDTLTLALLQGFYWYTLHIAEVGYGNDIWYFLCGITVSILIILLSTGWHGQYSKEEGRGKGNILVYDS